MIASALCIQAAICLGMIPMRRMSSAFLQELGEEGTRSRTPKGRGQGATISMTSTGSTPSGDLEHDLRILQRILDMVKPIAT